jgi:hypothetical protein
MRNRKIGLALAVAGMARHGVWPSPLLLKQLKRGWRAGHLFQRGRSMEIIIAKADAAGPVELPERARVA